MIAKANHGRAVVAVAAMWAVATVTSRWAGRALGAAVQGRLAKARLVARRRRWSRAFATRFALWPLALRANRGWRALGITCRPFCAVACWAFCAVAWRPFCAVAYWAFCAVARGPVRRITWRTLGPVAAAPGAGAQAGRALATLAFGTLGTLHNRYRFRLYSCCSGLQDRNGRFGNNLGRLVVFALASPRIARPATACRRTAPFTDSSAAAARAAQACLASRIFGGWVADPLHRCPDHLLDLAQCADVMIRHQRE